MTAADRYRQEAERLYSPTVESYAERDHERWAKGSGIIEALKEVVAEKRPKSVLELGVGTGRYFPFMTGQRFVGVDVSPTMLAVAKDRTDLLAGNGFTSIDLVEAEIGAWLSGSAGAELERFDLVYSIGCIGLHVPVTVKLMRLIRARMRPGALLYMQTTQAPLRRRVKNWPRELINRFQQGTTFDLWTTPLALRWHFKAAGLDCEWIRRDSKPWRGRPMLLSLARAPG